MLELSDKNVYEHADCCLPLSTRSGGGPWFGIRRLSPVRKLWRSFEVIINEAVDVDHLIYNGAQAGRPPSVKIW